MKSHNSKERKELTSSGQLAGSLLIPCGYTLMPAVLWGLLWWLMVWKASEMFHMLGNIPDIPWTQRVPVSSLVSNKKAVLFWGLSSIFSNVMIETVGVLVSFLRPLNPVTSWLRGSKLFLRFMYVFMLPGGICCVSLILIGRQKWQWRLRKRLNDRAWIWNMKIKITAGVQKTLLSKAYALGPCQEKKWHFFVNPCLVLTNPVS